jgi:DNA primase
VIPDEEVERVREAADIVAIIGEYVPLKGRGGNWRGPCPFHQGVNRNFSVSTTKGKFYHCFVCKESGDVFTFLQKRLGVDWPEAVRMVAQKSGIELHETRARREGPDPREPLWEANAAAQEYFQRLLWEDAQGGAARDYLASRDISRATADRFGLGYAPREIGLLRAYLTSIGIEDARLLECGLLSKREETEEPRPRFRSRLIFPIHDLTGRIAGFGGRLIGPGEPKYLNTGESPIYSKGKLLYHLHQARNPIRRADRAIVVEGYFDAMRLAAAGIESVVAPLGTALTNEQAQLLVRYSRNIYLLYDSDQAGLKATFRAGDELLAEGATVRVVTLPDGDDPDSFVQKHGAEALERQLRDAIDVFERKVQLLERGGWFADLTRRRAAIDRLLPTIRVTRDPVMRDLYLARASEMSRVGRDVLEREAVEGAAPGGGVRRGGAGTRGAGNRPRPSEGEGRDEPPPRDADEGYEGGWDDAPPREAAPAWRGAPGRNTQRRDDGRRPPAARPTRVVAIAAERYIVTAMLRSAAALERILERLGPESFQDPRLRNIFEALRDLGSAEHVDEVAERLAPEEVAVLDELLGEPDAILNLDRTVEDSLARLEERRLQERNREIDRLMTLATDEEKTALMREKTENARQVVELQALRTNS